MDVTKILKIVGVVLGFIATGIGLVADKQAQEKAIQSAVTEYMKKTEE